MLKAPQRLKVENGTELILPSPVIYDPKNYAFKGWEDEKKRQDVPKR